VTAVTMRKLTLLFKEEKGSSLVIAAAAMVALMGCAALVTDVGLLFAKRAKLMDTADAAALAGAQELVVSESAAEDVARDYIEMNGEELGDFTVQADDREIRVTGESEVEYYFARVLGFIKGDVGATAVAAAQGVTSARGIVPIGIDKDQPREPGKLYKLKVGAKSKGELDLGPGNFGALDLDNRSGGGADDYEYRLMNGYNEVIRVGQEIKTEQGNMAGPTEKGLNYRLDLCDHTPKCTICHYKPDCPRVVIVPVYEKQCGCGKKDLVVVGFSAFLLADADGDKGEIKGYFLNDIVFPGDSDPDQANYGVYAVKLIE